MVEPTVAIEVFELDQVPPVDELVSVVVSVKHSANVPPMPAGLLFTVTIVVAALPHPVEYVMIVVPCAAPETTPELLPTVATDVLLLTHVPAVEELASVVVLPLHIVVVPVIEPGVAYTVITFVEVPQMFVNDIVTVP